MSIVAIASNPSKAIAKAGFARRLRSRLELTAAFYGRTIYG
jgi:hypothetical protein